MYAHYAHTRPLCAVGKNPGPPDQILDPLLHSDNSLLFWNIFTTSNCLSGVSYLGQAYLLVYNQIQGHKHWFQVMSNAPTFKFPIEVNVIFADWMSLGEPIKDHCQ